MNESLPFSLRHDVALVTGGGTGIGLGIATALVQAGAKVILTGRRAPVLEQACDGLGGREVCRVVVGDVTQPKDRAAMLAEAEASFGQPLSILVNNAGNHLKQPAVDIQEEAFQGVMSTHVNAGFALSCEAQPQMLKAGRGSIVFLASMATFMGVPQVSVYTAAKCAVAGLTRSLAAEWSGQKIRVNAVAPGWIESPMLCKALDGDPARKAKILGRTPMGSFGQPDDVGQAVVYLCSPAARFVTGVVLPVDGGASIGF